MSHRCHGLAEKTDRPLRGRLRRTVADGQIQPVETQIGEGIGGGQAHVDARVAAQKIPQPGEQPQARHADAGGDAQRR